MSVTSRTSDVSPGQALSKPFVCKVRFCDSEILHKQPVFKEKQWPHELSLKKDSSLTMSLQQSGNASVRTRGVYSRMLREMALNDARMLHLTRFARAWV